MDVFPQPLGPNSTVTGILGSDVDGYKISSWLVPLHVMPKGERLEAVIGEFSTEHVKVRDATPGAHACVGGAGENCLSAAMFACFVDFSMGRFDLNTMSKYLLLVVVLVVLVVLVVVLLVVPSVNKGMLRYFRTTPTTIEHRVVQVGWLMQMRRTAFPKPTDRERAVASSSMVSKFSITKTTSDVALFVV
jgi:hypothetical protein